MTDADIKALILKSKFRELKKVTAYVRKKLPHVSPEAVKRVLETVPHDKYNLGSTDPQTHYYQKIFTPYFGGFQVDLLQQPRGATPPFFLVCVNVNTRFARVYPLSGKGEAEVLGGLQKFVADAGKVVKIVADKESAWNGKRVTDWLESHGIDSKLIEDEQHTALGIIDRFIRTLRTMNGDKKDFSAEDMRKIVKKYNKSPHLGIDPDASISPTDMEKNPKEQKRYIFQKLYDQERREKISDMNLHVGTYVRFIIPRKLLEKNRYRVSLGAVKVVKKDGEAYVCMAADGTTRTLQRWRLFPVGDTLPEGMTLHGSFGKNNGIIKSVVGKHGNKYRVQWEMPDTRDVVETIEPKSHIIVQQNGQSLIDAFEGR
jgi:hypothetical protein